MHLIGIVQEQANFETLLHYLLCDSINLVNRLKGI
jgi:hypothetical protein